MTIKRIISALVASALLVTSSLTANAANYHYSGNQAVADGEVDGIIRGALLNIGEFGCENLPVNPTDTPIEMLGDLIIDGIADKVGVGEILDYANCLNWCYKAFDDFGKALGEGGSAWSEYYENKILNAYTSSMKGCLMLAEKVMESGAAGKVIPDSVLEGCQKQVDSTADNVNELRSFAKNGWYLVKSKEVKQMANALEDLYQSIDIKALYQFAYNNSQRYNSIYNARTIGVSGALAVVGMSHGKLKGSRTSEYDVYCANKYREDIYWWCTESALNLDDQVTKFSSDVGTSEKINKLISLASNAQSGLVVQVNKSDNDQLRYLLGIGGADGDLLVLDPISGSCVPIRLKELCRNYGLDYNTTVSRICSVWSYVWA